MELTLDKNHGKAKIEYVMQGVNILTCVIQTVNY